MHFSRLRLSGFKSFVDPTELLIEPGLTGVVGPNGCGKSNLLEAIRWVMGENRAKSLRGAGMDDVIFSGTDRRSPRNMAEVTLVLDNFERNAPAAHNHEDMIEVTRRIERESGSAYRINGNDQRQKDVQLLFADAATGARSPALVSQGRIGSLINAKPEDRRAILEEAAGITGLYSRRREAESRLRSAEGNLVRLQDVIGAMENQIAGLKRQARQAVRYRTISNDIQQTEASLLYLRWATASEQVIVLESSHRDAAKLVAGITVRVAEISTAQAKFAATLPDLREADASAAAVVQRLKIEQENLDAEVARRKETADGLRARIKQIADDKAREEEISSDAGAALERLKSEQGRLKNAIEGEKEAASTAQETLETTSRTASDTEAEYDQLSERFANSRAQKSSLESDKLAIGRRLAQLASEKNRITQEIETLAATDMVVAAVKLAEEAIKREEGNLLACEKALESAEAATATARKLSSDTENKRSELAGKLKALDGEISSLKSLVSAGNKGSDAPVFEHLSAQAGYETAIGAALGADAEAGLDAAGVRYWAGCKTDHTVSSWPNGVTPIADYVVAPDALDARIAMTGLLDDASSGVKVEDLKPGQRVVAKDGRLWRWDGFTVKAGAPNQAAIKLAQKNQLGNLEQHYSRLQADMEHAARDATAAVTTHKQARAAEDTQRQTRVAAERALADAHRKLVAAEQDASRIDTRLASLRETLKRIDNEDRETKQRIAGIDEKITTLPDLGDMEAALIRARQHVEQVRSKLSNARAAYDSLRREAQARADRLTAIDSEATAWELRVTRAAKQLASLDSRADDTLKQLAAVEAGPELLHQKRQSLLSALNEAEQNRSQATESLLQAEAQLAEKDKALRSVQSEEQRLRENQIRAEAACETALNRRKDIALQIGERFECAPTKVLEKVGLMTSDTLPDVSVLDVTLEKLKRERDRLGAVNLRAEEELTDIEEQLAHLLSERRDLEDAIARLRSAIHGLNREGRQRLLAAFDLVNQHFGDLYASLFDGGQAHLKLTQSDDPLDAGLEIFASPPGKKLQALSLLSGGEQALTALALIFAVFITNPAPICVLDEVDAPLDDANVDRFCNLLDDMQARTDTRFLIVTHNAVSMSRMNRLFGVTMAERGISTLVSVDLERAEELMESA